MWHNNILETIGNTPLIKLNAVASHIKATVLIKAEYFNPGNSTKDRIAVKMVADAERAGFLKPGGTIIEATSGNTGFGLALVAAVKGYRCIFTLADKQSKEKVDILRSVGAEVIVCPTNVPADDPRSYYQTAKRLASEIPNSYFPFQYDNLSNTVAHYETTGPEIWKQTDGRITHFVAGMGTCGTICGASKFLKERNKDVKTIGIDTYGSLLQKLFETGEIDPKEIYPYMTEGIGEDFVPKNCDLTVIDKIIKVTDKDAALMARKLARLEGIFTGWSSGSAVHGGLQFAKELTANDIVVILLPDHGTRYVGKIYNDGWMSEKGFIDDSALLTAGEILNKKPKRDLMQLNIKDTLATAIKLLRENNISQLPVVSEGQVVGSVNETRLLNALIDSPALKEEAITTVMNDAFPFVLPSTRIDVIGKMLSGESQAVLVQQGDKLQIITKSDLIQALAG